jgi:hypothetical protein
MKKTATSKAPPMVREDLLPEYKFDYRKAQAQLMAFCGRMVEKWYIRG